MDEKLWNEFNQLYLDLMKTLDEIKQMGDKSDELKVRVSKVVAKLITQSSSTIPQK